MKAKHIFPEYRNDCFNVCHPWSVFEMIELDQIMCQQRDDKLTELLNRERIGLLTDEYCKILSERIVKKLNDNYPREAMHIWEENKPVDAHNKKMLDSINGKLVTIIAHDMYPTHVSDIDINKALERGRCPNAGLDNNIELKVAARVMLTTNVDVEDLLINGQIGTVVKIKMNRVSSKLEVIYVKFDDQNAGQVRFRKSGDRYVTANGVVPVTSVLGRFKVKENRQSSPEIQRTQFLLTPAWACTVHEIQGLTLPDVVFNFELFGQSQFIYGQVYVALNRVKALSNLSLVCDINTKSIRAEIKLVLGDFNINFYDETDS